MLLVSILNMTTHFHLEITWSSGLKPPWIFSHLCQKLDKGNASKGCSFAYNGEKKIDRNRSLSKSCGFTFNNEIIHFFNCTKNVLL